MGSVGNFLQTDPIPGGSANAYDYANQDPVNRYDLMGRSSSGIKIPAWAIKKIIEKMVRLGRASTEDEAKELLMETLETADSFGIRGGDDLTVFIGSSETEQVIAINAKNPTMFGRSGAQGPARWIRGQADSPYTSPVEAEFALKDIDVMKEFGGGESIWEQDVQTFEDFGKAAEDAGEL